MQAVIIGLAGSELHYLPRPAPAWGGPWRLRAGETGLREGGGVPTIPWRVSADEQLGLLWTQGGQRTPHSYAGPSPSTPAYWVLNLGYLLPMGATMSSKSSRCISLGAWILQLIL